MKELGFEKTHIKNPYKSSFLSWSSQCTVKPGDGASAAFQAELHEPQAHDRGPASKDPGSPIKNHQSPFPLVTKWETDFEKEEYPNWPFFRVPSWRGGGNINVGDNGWPLTIWKKLVYTSLRAPKYVATHWQLTFLTRSNKPSRTGSAEVPACP